MKNKKQILITGALCIWSAMANAQQIEPLTHQQRLFDDGKELFLRHDYAAARQTLIKYISSASDTKQADEAAYMIVCTTYELKAPDAIEQLTGFLKKYPESQYANRVRSLLASAYFFKEDYSEAIANYKLCEEEYLPNAERDANILRLGTAYMKTGELQSAAEQFRALKFLSKEYQPDAVYHLAYIDYAQNQYDKALEGFITVQRNPKYAPFAPYYIADIYLTQGQYAQAEKIASTYLEAYPRNEKTLEMKRIKGEALYGLKHYSEAVTALQQYKEEAGNKAERNAMYKLGMSYFNTGVYSKAAIALNEADSGKDALAQNAYLHQGLAYLNLKDRTRARMAFEQASAMTADKQIREQALYNYALCLHETSYSPFAESVIVFERFLNEFPNSVYTEKVNDYLVEVYTNTRSYASALSSIAKISHPGSRILEAKQKLLFRMGTQLFAQSDFDGAIDYFTQSLQLGQYNKQTQADAYYWRGESKYRKEQFEQAATDFMHYLNCTPNKQSDEYGLALYSLGYTDFKQKHYHNALNWFEQCIESGTHKERAVIADAYNRIGDCDFYARRFDLARNAYEKASSIDPSLADYSLFQEGLVKGIMRDYNGKISTLNQLLTNHPASQYVDDALYEQGRAFVQLEDNTNAINRYSLLVQRYPDSPLSRKAANEIGLLYYQNDRYDEAISAYKKVISSYPGSEEARLAQRDLKSIYIDLNKVDEYMTFASSIPGGGHLDINERDSLTYVAAERVYLRGNKQEARNSFIHYLQSFPQGAFSVDAHYYLGTMDYANQNYAEAAVHLDKVMEYPTSKYAGEAMSLCADMAYRQKDYAKAQQIYKRLTDIAETPQGRMNALTGVLRSAWNAADATETISAASAILAQNKLTPELSNEAHFYRAKCLLQEKKWDDAAKDLHVLAKDTRTAYGAEAKYLLAQLYFDLNETTKAEKEVLDYIEVSTPHAYWLARSFVLLSDVYMKLGRNIDAKQYLLSLKQNYQADDDIANMIETRLNKLNKGE